MLSKVKEISQKLKNFRLRNRSNIVLGSFLLNENKIFEAESLLGENNANCIRDMDKEGLIRNACEFSRILSFKGLNLEAIEVIRDAIEKTQPDYLYLVPNCYYQYTRIYWELGDLETAKKYCELAITQLLYSPSAVMENFDEKILSWKLYKLRGVIANALSEDIYQILGYFSLAKTMSLNHHFVEALPDIYLNISSAFLNFGNYKSAKLYLENCIVVSEEVDNFKILSQAYEILAEILGFQGNYRNAQSYFEKAIAIRLSLGLSMWSIYNKLAIMERSYGHFDKASVNHREALKYINLFQENRQKSLILSEYSITLIRMNKISLAKDQIESAKRVLMAQRRKNLPELCSAEGLYFLVTDGPNKALDYFFRAYSIAQEYSQAKNVVESSLYVIKCLLSLYNENFDVKYFLMAQKYINESYEIATESNLYPHIISIELLKGGLQAAEYNYGKALSTIAKAVTKANELGFKNESDDGRNFIKQINLVIKNVDHSSGILSPSLIQTGAVLSYVDKLIHMRDNKIGLFDFILVAFKFTNSGPEPFFISPSVDKFKKFDSVEFILNLGVMLTYLLGQGQEYFEGLYSLPVQGFQSMSLALVFSTKVSDSSLSLDKRMEGMNFVIFCFIYPQKFELDIARLKIKDKFQKFLDLHKDVALWEKQDLENLKLEIIDDILKKQTNS